MADIITSPVGAVTGIAVDTTGKFTPGAAFSINASVDIINAAWGQANAKMTAFELKVGDLGTELDALRELPNIDITASSAIAPTIADPGIATPAIPAAGDVVSTFQGTFENQMSSVVSRVSSCMATYFPRDTASYAAAETWLTSALANSSGLPAAVAAQIATDDQARILADSNRAQDAVIQTFAARRFPLPPGAAASAILQIQQKAQDSMAESSRKITIASIEQLRWAAEKVVSLRPAAMASALEYAKTLVAGASGAGQVTDTAYGAEAKLISSMASYHGARIEAAKVLSSVSEANASRAQAVAVANQAADLGFIDAKVKALLTEIQAIAQMATSLYNNVHAGAGSSYSVSA